MQFGAPVSWWTLLLASAAIGLLAWCTYAGLAIFLPRSRRVALAAIRAAVLLVLVACLLRPMRVLPPDAASDAVVPILVDLSRSMSLGDEGGRSRIEAAQGLVESDIAPALQKRFVTEVWGFGESLQRLGLAAPGAGSAPQWTADGRRSDLAGALQELRERYRNRRLAGIVVLSDGGDTGVGDIAGSPGDGVPVHTIGVGPLRIGSDREVLEVTAGEASLLDSAVDIVVTAVSHASDEGFDVRLLENGRPIDVRHVAPAGSAGPVRTVFTVAPAVDRATVYTAEIDPSPGELVAENNRASVAVAPPQRARRVLMLEGAPGFEHAFLKRALGADPGLEIDAVVRKGRNPAGEPTFVVQAPADRAPSLVAGFPDDRATLFSYDAIVLANVEGRALTRQQLDDLHAFVDQRGGGLLVLGARSFAAAGLAGTAVEAALPLRLADRAADPVGASLAGGAGFAVTLTAEGAAHPAMRLAPTDADVTKRWTVLPPLAGAAVLGAARPGAQTLALAWTPAGQRPLVAVQRYGRGRTMVFTGEGAWRWRMMMPSGDRTYELFWRHAVRWLSSFAPERLLVETVPSVLPGETATIGIDVRDARFTPVATAGVALRVMSPTGAAADVTPSPSEESPGRFAADVAFGEPGLYHVVAEAEADGDRQSSERWVLVGGVDREMAQPRLNEDVLRRLSDATGGRYISAGETPALADVIASAASVPQAVRVREIWHTPWVFGMVLALLTVEWSLRRRSGLR